MNQENNNFNNQNMSNGFNNQMPTQGTGPMPQANNSTFEQSQMSTQGPNPMPQANNNNMFGQSQMSNHGPMPQANNNMFGQSQMSNHGPMPMSSKPSKSNGSNAIIGIVVAVCAVLGLIAVLYFSSGKTYTCTMNTSVSGISIDTKLVFSVKGSKMSDFKVTTDVNAPNISDEAFEAFYERAKSQYDTQYKGMDGYSITKNGHKFTVSVTASQEELAKEGIVKPGDVDANIKYLEENGFTCSK